MILSICIPSYNRFEKLNDTISKITISKSKDFDIVIVDNCSPRRIEDFIDCSDERIKIYHREEAVRGERNVNECVKFGDGKYSLLLLDKDVIDGRELEKLIEILKGHEIAGGYCVINSKNDKYEIVDENRVLKFGYLSKHPSGNIYNTNIVSEFINNETNLIESNSFGFDYCLSYVASKGSMLYYDAPLISSNLSEPTDTVEKSLSFSPEKKNVYYFPQNRIDEFRTYLHYLDKLDIGKEEKIKKTEQLYQFTINAVSIGYRKIMKNKFICYHYGHKTKRVFFLEMFKNYLKVKKILFDADISYLPLVDKKKLNTALYKRIMAKFLRFKN